MLEINLQAGGDDLECTEIQGDRTEQNLLSKAMVAADQQNGIRKVLRYSQLCEEEVMAGPGVAIVCV